MGSAEPVSGSQWTTGRILRLVVPPLLVLVAAWTIRERERHVPPTEPAVGTKSSRRVPEASLAAAPAHRIVILAEDATALATALRARLAPEVEIVSVPASRRDEAAREWGIARLPAVVVEQADAERSVCSGEDAVLAAVVRRCRELGVPFAAEDQP